MDFSENISLEYRLEKVAKFHQVSLFLFLVCNWFLVQNISLIAFYMCVSLHIERSLRKKVTVAHLVKSLRRLYPAVHFHANKSAFGFSVSGPL
jgi:hypothetical protein